MGVGPFERSCCMSQLGSDCCDRWDGRVERMVADSG